MHEQTGPVIGVVGGAGGVGTSTFAAVLAGTAGGVLIDADGASGGIDVRLGIDEVAGCRWSGVRLAGGRLDPRVLVTSLPRWGAAYVLAADADPDADAVTTVCEAARTLGPVVVDLGRGWSAAAAHGAQCCDLVLVLSPADLPSLVAARATVGALALPSCGLLLRRGPVSDGDAAALVGLPLVAVLPRLGRRTEALLDPGHLPRGLARAAAGIVDGCRT